ncbi:MAG: hypothetical protein ABJO67_21535 [Pseudoruegeria sp.]
MSRQHKALGIAAILVICATGAQAQQNGQGGRPPMPSFDKMASDLGISASTVKNCFPAPSQGSGQPERPDIKQVADCLQKSNGNLTQEQIHQTIQKNGPQPPQRN